MNDQQQMVNELIADLTAISAGFRKMTETVDAIVPASASQGLRRATVEITRVTAEECSRRLDEVIEQLRLKTIPTPPADSQQRLPQETILVSEHLREVLRFTEMRIDSLAGRHVGICLVVFTDGRMQYVSNCDRAIVAAPLQQLINNWRDGLPDIKAHEVH